RAGPERPDGRGGAAGQRTARPRLPLIFLEREPIYFALRGQSDVFRESFACFRDKVRSARGGHRPRGRRSPSCRPGFGGSRPPARWSSRSPWLSPVLRRRHPTCIRWRSSAAAAFTCFRSSSRSTTRTARKG